MPVRVRRAAWVEAGDVLMPTLMGGIEVFSALEDHSIIEPCRVLSVTGTCSVCGFATRGVHAPGVCHGFYCAEHCPVCSGAIEITTAEREAMVANRWRPMSTLEKQSFIAGVEPVKHLRRDRISAAIRAEEHAWLLKRTLHVASDFKDSGLIYLVVRDSDGCLVADILEAVRRLPASQNVAAEMINRGVEAGTLRLS